MYSKSFSFVIILENIVYFWPKINLYNSFRKAFAEIILSFKALGFKVEKSLSLNYWNFMKNLKFNN